MPKVLGLVVSFAVSMAMIQVAAEVLHLRAISLRVERPPTQTLPRGPVHEVDRDASAGAMFT